MAVIRRGASEDGWFAVGEDGSSFFIPPEVFAEYSLYDGMEVAGEQLWDLERSCLLLRIRRKAFDLLAGREHSRQQLRLKLLQRSFPDDGVDQVLDDLEERSLLDDRRFAETWTSSRLRRNPEGKARLAAGLAARGVSRGMIEEVLSGISTDEALERAFGKLAARPSMTEEKLVAALMRKGFSYGDIRRILELHRTD